MRSEIPIVGFLQRVVTAFACPPVSVLKRPHWPRMGDELFATDWDLLLCSAGALSAIFCEHSRQAGRRALDVGAFDQMLFVHLQESRSR